VEFSTAQERCRNALVDLEGKGFATGISLKSDTQDNEEGAGMYFVGGPAKGHPQTWMIGGVRSTEKLAYAGPKKFSGEDVLGLRPFF